MENELKSLFSAVFQLLSALTQEIAILSERAIQHDSSLDVKSARERTHPACSRSARRNSSRASAALMHHWGSVMNLLNVTQTFATEDMALA
jgi:hypothetical protein